MLSLYPEISVDSSTNASVTNVSVMRETDSFVALSEAIEFLGSQSALARLLGITQQSVSHWVQRRKPLPAEHVLAVEAATGVSRHELRPDIYPIETPRAPGQSQASPGATSAAGAPCPAAGDSSNTGIPSGREGNAPAAEISEAAAGVSETGERA